MSRTRAIPILLLIILSSAVSVTLFLKPADILSPSPIYTDDYAMHFSQCLTSSYFLSSSGRCWGYDPYFLAGYPSGALANADNKAWELFFFVLSPLLGPFAFKLYLILFLLLYPLFLYAAARNFNLARGPSLIAPVLGILFFHLSLPVEFVSWGMLSYVFMVYFSIYLLSLFYKLFESFTVTRYLILCLLTALSLLMHILTPVHLFIPIAVLYAGNAARLSLKQHAAMAGMILFVLAVNSYWLLPVLQFFNDKTVRPENYEFTLQIKSFFEPFSVYFLQHPSVMHRKLPELNRTFIDTLLLVLSICGLYSWWKEKKFSLFLSFAAGGLFVFIIAYYGSHTHFFPPLQPQRFTIPLNILLIIPACAGLYLLARTLLQGKPVAAKLCAACLLLIVLVAPAGKILYTIYTCKLYRLSCGVPSPFVRLTAYFKDHTSRAGRILIEDSEFDTLHQFFGSHYTALLPEYVKREYLCGPRPMYPVLQSYASFTAGTLFERKLETFSHQELQRYFDGYNVCWIAAWRKESKQFFDRFPGYMVRLSDIDNFTVYEVKRTATFFLKGSGTVRADYNRLELTDIVPEQGEIIISYHWMKFFKTIPQVRIERADALGDPAGFIKIINPPPSLVVVNGY